MTLDEAYKILRLTPLDQFISQQVARNGAALRPRKKMTAWDLSQAELRRYKGIGATTWMCVRVALALMDGQEVTIIDADILQRASVSTVILDVLTRLGLTISPVWGVGGTFDFSNGAVLRVRGAVSEVNRGILFSDAAWKTRAVCRAEGPFAMLREIRYENGGFHAYAEDDEYLLELTKEGALELMEAAKAAASLTGVQAIHMLGCHLVEVGHNFGRPIMGLEPD